MRRGLIEWSKTELPETVFDSRIRDMRAAMAAACIDVMVVYTNITCPSAVSWLCNFIPYFSECALVLPESGDMTLVSAVTPRSKPWIASTTYAKNLLFAPKIGPETARVLGDLLPAGGTVGVVDLEGIPVAIAAALKGAGMTLMDATNAFVAAREAGDSANVALAHTAARFAHQALSAFDANGTDAMTAIAAVDRTARKLGAEESFIAVAPDLQRDRRLLRLEGPVALGTAYAVRASIAYKGTWVRMIRSVVRNDASGMVRSAANLFAAAVAELPRLDALAAMDSWLVETTRAAQPLEAVAGSSVRRTRDIPAGAVVSVQSAIVIGGIPIWVGAAAKAGAAGSPGKFLVTPAF